MVTSLPPTPGSVRPAGEPKACTQSHGDLQDLLVAVREVHGELTFFFFQPDQLADLQSLLLDGSETVRTAHRVPGMPGLAVGPCPDAVVHGHSGKMRVS